MSVRVLIGDALGQLRLLPDESAHCCVTSPPYYGLRDYGCAGQIGLEPSPDEYVAALVAVFREVRRVLRKDGTLWLNIGDSYSAHAGQRKTTDQAGIKQQSNVASVGAPSRCADGCKPKDLIGIPWMVAFALRADGWWLRQDIIWSKPNPMPESVTDRCTKAHEYLFLLSKSERYCFDAAAIREANSNPELTECQVDWRDRPNNGEWPSGTGGRMGSVQNGRNKRSVWTVAGQPFAESHFATFPPALIEPCILAGCPRDCCAQCGAPWVRDIELGAIVGRRDNGAGDHFVDLGMSTGRAGLRERLTKGWRPSCGCGAGIARGVCLDPFGGAGTTGLVADRLGRDAVLIELNPEYAEMARRRIIGDAPLFASVA